MPDAEEGFPIETLARILDSMKAAAAEGNVTVACGDTKVVEKGNADGIFITTAGVGIVRGGWRPAPENVRPGDRVILKTAVGGMRAVDYPIGDQLPRIC